MSLLTGLTQDGAEVPVQVKPDGRLVAEGLEGPPGPAGPAGPKGDAGPQGDSEWAKSGSDLSYTAGRVLIGTSTARDITGAGLTQAQINFEAPNTYHTTLLATNVASSDGSYLCFVKSRGTSVGSTTVVNSGDDLGNIVFAGADGTRVRTGASISAKVDGTPGANDMPGRIVLSTTSSGASSSTEQVRIDKAGFFYSYKTYSATTASAANVFVDSNGSFNRSTSSIKYKTDIETIDNSYSDRVLDIRPVWYRSTCEKDCPDHSWWGFIAEEVAQIDPRLVHWKTVEISYDENGSALQTPCEPEPEGVAYDRFVPHLLNLIKRQKEQIETLEARLTAAGL